MEDFGGDNRMGSQGTGNPSKCFWVGVRSLKRLKTYVFFQLANSGETHYDNPNE
jgi:hypothetical protein